MMCGKAELDLNTIFQTISHQFNSSDTNTDEEMCLCHACVSALSCKTDPWNSPKTRMIPSSFRTAVTSRFHSELIWTSFNFSPQLRKWFNLQKSISGRKSMKCFKWRWRERDWSHSTEIFRKTINQSKHNGEKQSVKHTECGSKIKPLLTQKHYSFNATVNTESKTVEWNVIISITEREMNMIVQYVRCVWFVFFIWMSTTRLQMFRSLH